MSETLSDRPAALEWFTRDVGLPAACPAKLASMVDGALDRADRVLFTITPREELDVSAQWQRISDQAWCGQLRHVVACTARLSGSDRDFVGDELALALGVSPLTGRALVWEYGAIACLPGLVEAVETGRLTVRHVTAFMRVLEDVSLSLEQRQAVALIALGRFTDQTPGGWAELIRRLVVTIDPHAAARRRDERTSQRKARFFPQADEQGAMWLQAPAAQLARVQARLDAEATRLKAAGDERTSDQLVCDVALALLADGTLGEQPVTPYEVHVIVPLSILEDDAEAGADADDRGQAEAPDAHADAEVALAEIPGWASSCPTPPASSPGRPPGSPRSRSMTTARSSPSATGSVPAR